jgi:glycosyltransferase involved in cell wall biosynthesis
MNGMTTVPRLKYTAVLTAFNAEKTIARAIKGILTQELAASQIVIIDDCSTDLSLDIARNFAREDTRISIIQNNANEGQSHNRNAGVALFSSDFVIFFDDDDFSHSGRATEHYKMLHKGATISYVSSEIIYPNGYSRKATNSGFNGKFDSTSLTKKLLLGRDSFRGADFCVPSSTLAVNTRVFRSLGGFDVSLRRLEDVDLAIRFALDDQIFSFSSKNLVSRYSTSSDAKGNGIDMKFERVLLEKYSKMLSSSDFKFAITHCDTRRLYFSRKYSELVVHFMLHPFYFLQLLLAPDKPLKRLVHDARRKLKL